MSNDLEFAIIAVLYFVVFMAIGVVAAFIGEAIMRRREVRRFTAYKIRDGRVVPLEDAHREDQARKGTHNVNK